MSQQAPPQAPEAGRKAVREDLKKMEPLLVAHGGTTVVEVNERAT